ncbi:XRE family transcriptional regulator [Actinacidiphila sp. bgisy145]|uniref:XRE family transcriptional regulator n=1 Tax=Actinacidiphila sp. bgisy145 TaxID=3413792 RepID=UPI003EBA48FD
MGEGLRAARTAHGWSQERLVREIERYARRHLLDVASTASLRVYVSDWENSRRSLSGRYTRILRALLGITDTELNGKASAESHVVSGYDELLACIDSARNVSLTMVETFMAQTELLRTIDRQAGAAGLVDQMRGHLAALEEALTFAILPETKQPIALALAGAATLAAWQALDVGAVERAWRHYELGKRAAQEAGAPMYLAHAMGEQAYVLYEAGRPETALEIIGRARHAGRRQHSPRLRAWLLAAEAEMSALSGDSDTCRRALDAASDLLPPGDAARDPDMLSIFLNPTHLARWRGHCLTLLGDDDAMSCLYATVRTTDPTFVRASAGVRLDLATAHLAREEHTQADEHLRAARLIAGRTGSVRYRRRIERLTELL